MQVSDSSTKVVLVSRSVQWYRQGARVGICTPTMVSGFTRQARQRTSSKILLLRSSRQEAGHCVFLLT